MELWEDVVGWEGLYEVSNLGRVKSLSRVVKRGEGELRVKEKIRVLVPNTKGYLQVKLCNQKIKKYKIVHRLVGECFVENPSEKPCINHKNGIKTDNRAVNLEWCTYRENNLHAIKSGLIGDRTGTNNSNSKLSEDDVKEIKGHLANGKKLTELAEIYNVTFGLIGHIKSGRIWSHI